MCVCVGGGGGGGGAGGGGGVMCILFSRLLRFGPCRDRGRGREVSNKLCLLPFLATYSKWECSCLQL